jgi:hypothetical protein
VSSLWVIVLLVTTAQEASHRGMHDRIVGSLVLGPLPAVPGFGYPGPRGYWPPPPSPWTAAPTPPYPGYPAQIPAYPAQAPGARWAPPYPGYPYPGQPFYPPSAWPAGQAGPNWPPAPTNAPAGPPPVTQVWPTQRSTPGTAANGQIEGPPRRTFADGTGPGKGVRDRTERP